MTLGWQHWWPLCLWWCSARCIAVNKISQCIEQPTMPITWLTDKPKIFKTTNNKAPQFHPQNVHKWMHVFAKWWWGTYTVLVAIYRPGYHPVYNHCRFKNSNVHICIYTEIWLLSTVLGLPWLRQCHWPLTTEAWVPISGQSKSCTTYTATGAS